MSTDVSWMLELEVQAEREDDIRVLMAEMTDSARNEVGTLSYEWSTSEDGSRCHLWERYTNSEAAITHLEIFGQRFADRFLEVFKPVRLVVYGLPTTALKEVLSGFSPVYMEPASGFSR